MIQDNLFINNEAPATITKEQTYEYFKQFYNGNMKAREKIIEHNIRLVLFEVGRKFTKYKCDYKDLVSVGIIGLIKSVDTFDISKSYEFATYATRCIDNEILMYLRKDKKHNGVYSLDEVAIKFNDGGDVNLKEMIADDCDLAISLENKETNNLLKIVIEQLPELEKEAIKLHFGFVDDTIYNQSEIAEKLNYSQSYISRVIKKGLLKIEILLKELGDDNVKQDFDNKLKKKVFK